MKNLFHEISLEKKRIYKKVQSCKFRRVAPMGLISLNVFFFSCLTIPKVWWTDSYLLVQMSCVIIFQEELFLFILCQKIINYVRIFKRLKACLYFYFGVSQHFCLKIYRVCVWGFIITLTYDSRKCIS